MSDALPPYPSPRCPRGDRPASLARRVVPAVAILGAAGGLLVLLDHPAATPGSATSDVLPEVPGSPSTSAPTTQAGPSDGTSPSSSTTTTVPATPGCSGATTSLTGSTVSTRFGPVQLEATVDAEGHLCSVQALQTPDHDHKSVAINQVAVPMLTERALASGGTDFDGVSGATFTSEAYRVSLQSILDQR